MSLSYKRIIVAITGGIAAYKAAELVRLLRSCEAQVQVVMTQGAKQFIGTTTMQALSGRTVRHDVWDEQAEAAMGHIELARWAQAIVIAPASANCIGKLASGFADDLLTTLCLASTADLYIAPAMNRIMWQHQAVQANIQRCLQRGAVILGPAEGEQACGESGAGRLLSPDNIVAALKSPEQVLAGLHVVMTAGPTQEPIDPVRYLSNRSSGKMGYALALAAQQAGAKVTLISGPTALTPPLGVNTIFVRTAEQMHQHALKCATDADIFIGVAAVADYRMAEVCVQKIKKKSNTMALNMVKNPDIISSISALSSRPFVVGFSAETDSVHALGYAQEKSVQKGCDMMVVNEVGDNKVFGQDRTAFSIIVGDHVDHYQQASKQSLAVELVAKIAREYVKNTSKMPCQ